MKGRRSLITVDDREVLQHPDIPDLLKVPTQVERLDAGDYAFLNRSAEAVGIERSEINNLMQKLTSGELEQQLRRCAEGYTKVILLVEGVYDSIGGYLSTYKQTSHGYYRVRTYPNTRYESVVSLLARLQELGIDIVHSPNFGCSMTTVRSIYNQATKPEGDHQLFRSVRPPNIPTKLTNNPAVSKLLALCTRLEEKTAIRLIQKYGTIWNILQADDKELLEVEGFGKTLVKRLKEGVGIQ